MISKYFYKARKLLLASILVSCTSLHYAHPQFGFPPIDRQTAERIQKELTFPRLHRDKFQFIRQRAMAGEAHAQASLGLSYLKAHGYPLDYKLAEHWLLKAANQGLAEAQFHLALIYHKGKGDIQQNYKKAGKWCRVAAEQGLAPAQYLLAKMLMNGDVFERDLQLAQMQAYIAFALGSYHAHHLIIEISHLISSEENEVARNSARVWLVQLNKKHPEPVPNF